ncbi:MAG: hypothetical protein V3S73_00880 [Gammaproteobacteria bacterium]
MHDVPQGAAAPAVLGVFEGGVTAQVVEPVLTITVVDERVGMDVQKRLLGGADAGGGAGGR